MEVNAYFTAESLVAAGFKAFSVAFKSRIQECTNIDLFVPIRFVLRIIMESDYDSAR